MTIRVLTAEDTPALEDFLTQRWAASMILRSNLRATPIGSDGPYAGKYAARLDGTRMLSVAAYYPLYTNIILQAPEATAEVARAATGQNKVLGILGPLDQVKTTMAAFGLTSARIVKSEVLYSLDIANMRMPPIRDLRCRLATPADLEVIVPWRVAYNIESLRAADIAESRTAAQEEMARLVREGAVHILENDGPVALALFACRVPGAVQIGGVWTPPALRGRGYGRRVVAAALKAAQVAGVTRAVLFTDDSNLPARKAYEALGFEIIGDYGVAFFEG